MHAVDPFVSHHATGSRANGLTETVGASDSQQPAVPKQAAPEPPESPAQQQQAAASMYMGAVEDAEERLAVLKGALGRGGTSSQGHL